jgi:radical SAM protein with 4Fe4S-binding SPASM domain
MKFHNLKKEIMDGKYSINDKELILNKIENLRDKSPVVYAIGTTNHCNMKCQFCPRTTRPPKVLKTMDIGMFENIVNQLSPIDNELWLKWCKFCEKEYNIMKNEMNENHFYLYVISHVEQIHLFGDPLLDKNIDKCVKLLTDRGIKSYFSCNPSNINLKKVEKCFDSGLDYIKFSLESTNDEEHKKIRGDASNFTKSYQDICKLLEIKKKNNYKTTIVITMLDLNQPNQQEQYDKLMEYFKDKEVYIFIKSQDTQWYDDGEYHGTNSVHWKEACFHGWSTMTIDPWGQAVECMESNASEIVLGNVNDNSLYDIWNGEKYKEFRRSHIYLTQERCMKECDMNLIGSYLK